jgi:threonyl-tRNA synthetase
VLNFHMPPESEASSSSVAITLPDGKVRHYPGSVTGGEIAASIGPGLAKAAVAIKLDGVAKDLSIPITHDAKIAIVTRDTQEALEIIRHDAAHVMAEAVKELYPETQVTFGPATDTGFYYDFARATPFTPDDLVRIEQRMHEIVDRDEAVTREEWERDRAAEFFAEQGEKYKAEWIHEIPKDEAIRPASALDREARPRIQADESRRRLLAWRCAQRAASACLRHCLGE